MRSDIASAAENLNPHLDEEIHGLDFSSFDERGDILGFLERWRPAR
jgi:hypothetical protein